MRLFTRWILLGLLLAAASSALAFEWRIRRAITRPAYRCGIPPANYQHRDRSRSVALVSRTALLLPTRRAVEPSVPRDVQTLISSEQIRRLADDRVSIARSRTQTNRQLEGDATRQQIDQRRRFEILPPPAPPTGLAVLPPSNWPGAVSELFRRGSPPLHRDDSRTRRDVVTRLRPDASSIPRIRLYQLDRSQLAINHCAISEVALQLHDNGRWVLSLRADQNRVVPGQDHYPFLHLKRNEFVVRLRCLGAFQVEPIESLGGVGKPVLAALHPPAFWVQRRQPAHPRLSGDSAEVRAYFAQIDRVEIEFFYR